MKRDNPKLFSNPEKNNFKSEKIFRISMFFEIILSNLLNLKELLQILIKFLDPEIPFSKSETSSKIQETLSNPEKCFGN